MATVDIQTLLSSNLPLGFTGSIGYTGSQGFTGSQGEKGDRYKTTSSTQLTISSSGTATFTIETELGYSINQTIKVSYDTGNYMIMNITSYNSNTGVMQADVLSSVGSGAYSSWIVNLEGAVGEIGYTGSQGFTGSSGAFAAVGFTGSKGDFGYTGSAGSTGFVGSQGPAGGFTGSAGFTGSQGYTGSGSSVGGSNTQIQYNNNGVFGGSANLTWSQPTTTLTVTGNIYFPNEASASYPGGYKSAFTLSDGFLESNFTATGGNLYFGAGFAPSPTSTAANMYIGDNMNLSPPGAAQANIYIGGASNNSQIYLRGITNFPNEANPAYPGAYRSTFFDSTGVFESTFSAAGGNLYFGAGFAPSPTSTAANMYIGDNMNLSPPGVAQANIYIGGASNNSQIYLRGRSYLQNVMTYNPAVTGAPTGYTGATYRAGAFYSDGTLQSFFSAANSQNFYIAQGFAPGPSAVSSIYLGSEMNLHPNGVQANIYLGGASNNSQIYLRGNIYFPNEISASYPGIWKSMHASGTDGVAESIFGATGGTLYFGAGFGSSPGTVANMYIGDAMNYNVPGGRQANIYIGGANNDSQIYLRGITNFPNEAAPASYSGAYRSTFFDASGVFESNFGATSGNLYFGAGFAPSPSTAANMWIGDNMNLSGPGAAQANIYLGGASNNSQIYLRGITNFPNEAAPAYPGAYRSAFFDSTGVFESTFGATSGNLYFGAGFAPSPGTAANMYIGDNMNLSGPGAAQANIYIGGGSNNSRIFLRGFGTVAPLGGVGNRAVYSDASGVLTNSSSDRTVKTNIRSVTYGLEEILQLVPVIYNWIDVERLGSQDEIGLIANDVELIMPELVSINKDGTKSLDYPKIVAPLIKAIQQITARLSVLENK